MTGIILGGILPPLNKNESLLCAGDDDGVCGNYSYAADHDDVDDGVVNLIAPLQSLSCNTNKALHSSF